MRPPLLFLSLLIFVFSFTYSSSDSQVKKVRSKPPRFTLSFALGYDYAVSRAYGSVYGFSTAYDSTNAGNYFNGQNYGMLQGGSFMNIGKLALDRKRRVRATYNVGYSLFYNAAAENSNIKTQWHVFNGGLGLEYNFSPRARFKSYIGFELLYSIMFGSWDTDYVDTSGTKSNIHVKFKPAHRFGMALNSGVELKINKRTGFVIGNRAIWLNIAPKQNKLTSSITDAHINDSKDDSGINVGFTKQIVYLQVLMGINVYFYR
jgi:hypothetical protein